MGLVDVPVAVEVAEAGGRGGGGAEGPRDREGASEVDVVHDHDVVHGVEAQVGPGRPGAERERDGLHPLGRPVGHRLQVEVAGRRRGGESQRRLPGRQAQQRQVFVAALPGDAERSVQGEAAGVAPGDHELRTALGQVQRIGVEEPQSGLLGVRDPHGPAGGEAVVAGPGVDEDLHHAGPLRRGIGRRCDGRGGLVHPLRERHARWGRVDSVDDAGAGQAHRDRLGQVAGAAQRHGRGGAPLGGVAVDGADTHQAAGGGIDALVLRDPREQPVGQGLGEGRAGVRGVAHAVPDGLDLQAVDGPAPLGAVAGGVVAAVEVVDPLTPSTPSSARPPSPTPPPRASTASTRRPSPWSSTTPARSPPTSPTPTRRACRSPCSSATRPGPRRPTTAPPWPWPRPPSTRSGRGPRPCTSTSSPTASPPGAPTRPRSSRTT